MSIEELIEKLDMIDRDLDKLKGEPGNDRKIEALTEYREYISEQIKMLKDGE
jgi:hypothetical protein